MPSDKRSLEISMSYSSCAGRLHMVASAIVRDSDLAWDAVHTVFLRIVNTGNPSAMLTQRYLTAAVRNECVTMLRKQRRERLCIERMQPYASGDVVSADTTSDDGERVHDALHQSIQDLPPRARAVLKHKLMGWTNAHIADHLGISVKTVEYHYSAARRILKRVLRTTLAAYNGAE